MEARRPKKLGKILTALAFLVGVAHAAGEPAPLSPQEQEILRAAPDEPLAEPLTKHYPRTNEWRLDVLFAALKDLGGGYVGVGSDQNYTIAAAAHSEALFLIDHDPIVRDLHLAYGPLIIASDTPDAFIARFAKPGRDEARKLITAAHASDARRQKVALRAFDDYAAGQLLYFKKQQARQADGKPVTWLGDAELYRWTRALFQAGRVHTVAADLTGTHAMAKIAESAKALKVPIRIVYFSNAEDFFPVTAQVRANYHALPTDDKSLLIRTVYMGLPKAEGSVWHYQTQAWSDFLGKLDRPKEYPGHRRMVIDLKGPEGKKFIDARGSSRITPELPRWEQKK